VLARCGRTEPLWSRLRQWPARDQRLRTFLVHRFGQLKGPPELLRDRVKAATEAAERRALLLALGSCQPTRPENDWDDLRRTLLGWYQSDPDPGVHGAVWWLLNRWDREGYRKRLGDIDATA